MVVKYETVVGQDIGGGITRRILAHNGNMMIVDEQVSYILSGSFQYTMEEEVYELKRGDTYYVPPGVLHGATALEDAVILDIFTPQREDFLE